MRSCSSPAWLSCWGPCSLFSSAACLSSRTCQQLDGCSLRWCMDWLWLCWWQSWIKSGKENNMSVYYCFVFIRAACYLCHLIINICLVELACCSLHDFFFNPAKIIFFVSYFSSLQWIPFQPSLHHCHLPLWWHGADDGGTIPCQPIDWRSAWSCNVQGHLKI